jgi:hypothetical protein
VHLMTSNTIVDPQVAMCIWGWATVVQFARGHADEADQEEEMTELLNTVVDLEDQLQQSEAAFTQESQLRRDESWRASQFATAALQTQSRLVARLKVSEGRLASAVRLRTAATERAKALLGPVVARIFGSDRISAKKALLFWTKNMYGRHVRTHAEDDEAKMERMLDYGVPMMRRALSRVMQEGGPGRVRYIMAVWRSQMVVANAESLREVGIKLECQTAHFEALFRR